MKENVKTVRIDKMGNLHFWKLSSLNRKDSLFERLGGLKKDRLFCCCCWVVLSTWWRLPEPRREPWPSSGQSHRAWWEGRCSCQASSRTPSCWRPADPGPRPRLLGSSNPPSLSPLLHTSLLGDIVSRYSRFTQVQHSCLQCSSSLWRHREAYDVTSVNCMPFIEVSGRR